MQRPLSRPLTELFPVELSVLGAEPGIVTVYGWQNMTFVVWTGPASASSVDVLERLGTTLRERHPRGLSSVHIIVPGQTHLPTAEARAQLVRLTNEYADWLGAIAVVIAGSGFWASAMRSVVTAMRVLGSRAFEMRIHGRVDEVVQWLPAAHLKRTGVQIEPEQLLRALRQAEHGQTAT